MRRITLWITATLVLTALLVAYQLNVSGAGAKGEGGHEGNPPAPTAPQAPSSAKPGDDTPGDGRHTGKPGENK